MPKTKVHRIQPCYQRIGKRIRDLRMQKNMTQDTLSKRVKLSRASIANIEVGRARIALHYVQTFARALGTDVMRVLKSGW